jgi:hypothetical protein
VETTSIDDLVDEVAGDGSVSVLKLDVQGGEQEALIGAERTLTSVKAILIEVTFVSHYEGDATFPVLHQRLTGDGFELAALGEPFKSNRGTVLWCDACYTPVV